MEQSFHGTIVTSTDGSERTAQGVAERDILPAGLLGRGSPNTINEHLDAWWLKLGARLLEKGADRLCSLLIQPIGVQGACRDLRPGTKVLA